MIKGNTKDYIIDVCLSPALLHLHQLEESIVVVIDILRATSTMCTAFQYGAVKVIPVETVEESRVYRDKGYLAGAERNGKKVEGFSFGNSPFDLMSDNIKGKEVVMTTTNGTRAIMLSKNAFKVVIGAFLNLEVLYGM